MHDLFLKEKLKHGIRPGLERILALMETFNHPQEGMRILHIAGTNGKGSVSAMLSAILQAAGYKVGRYNSPHLYRYTERITFNDREISHQQLDALLNEVGKAARELEFEHPEWGPFTEFELLTAVAFLAFAREGIHTAVLETGLGGRLDATNVVKRPWQTIITNIAMDHCDLLGNTLEEIAGEKAGILKPGVPLVTGAHGAALDVIAQEAQKLGCPMMVPSKAEFVAAEGPDQVLRYGERDWSVPLLGTYQWHNVPLAIEAARRLGIPDNTIAEGLTQAKWPGRMEVITDPQGVKWLLDGAHNLDGMQALLDSWDIYFPDEPIWVIFGVLKDKDYRPMIDALLDSPRVKGIKYVAPDSMRALTHAELQRYRAMDGEEGLEAALQWARQKEGIHCICGSLYLVGGAREALQSPKN